MNEVQKIIIQVLLFSAVVIWFVPIVWRFIRLCYAKKLGRQKRKTGASRLLMFSAWLIGAIWCLRYAVACNNVFGGNSSLTLFEEIFQSFTQVLQTFSLDAEYDICIQELKALISSLVDKETSQKTFLIIFYGIYSSVLNFVAPIAGGAVIFEILASIFPKIKLRIAHWIFWRGKYYFSELNEASLALATSILDTKKSLFQKPIIVFLDVYVDDEDEKSSEMMLEAKALGAICVSDDLSHVRKNRWGLSTFFLIDENESSNLQILANLSSGHNSVYLKRAEIYLFTQDDVYVQVEKEIQDKLLNEMNFSEKDLPGLRPVQRYRNLVSNLLVNVPLYEPLINMDRKCGDSVDLTVTILGTGHIGTEMFLSSYWFGQILDCNLNINIVSQESEEDFWNKIDYINPEIHHTTIDGDPILIVNRSGEMGPVYCKVNYIQCDIKSSTFVDSLLNPRVEGNILNTDYFLVSLGSDEENLSVANTLRRYIGQYHISVKQQKRTVITYVIYNSQLANTLNRTKRYSFVGDRADVYMQAIGSLQEVYSAKNVFMTDYELLAEKVQENYLSKQNIEKRADAHKKRMKDEYSYWSNLARAMHVKYKFFSMGLLTTSLFEVESPMDSKYINSINEAYEGYKKIAKCLGEEESEAEFEKYEILMHRMAWLEHRRWNAFMRVKGFRKTSDYDSYAVKGEIGSYKQMDLKLHPCLVECGQRGILPGMKRDGTIDAASLLKCKDKSKYDLLDEISYDLYDKKYNNYDFKQYDYPIDDVKTLESKKKKITKKK